jgi:carbamoyltransferase
MNIASISNFARYESSFTLLTDRNCSESGRLDFLTIDEERLLRAKHTYSFPLLAMEYCLKHFGIESLSEIDYLITDYARVPSIYNDGPGYRKLEHDYLKGIIDIAHDRIVTVNHHLAHTAGVFYPSGFDEAAVLIIDGMGSDLETQSLFHCRGNDLELVERAQCWGIGSLYSEVTGQILRFTGLNGVDLAGKTMGLAPYGRNSSKRILDIRARYNGMHSDYSYFISRFPKPIIKQAGLKSCENPADVTNEYFSRVAFEVQEEAEKAIVHFANHAYKVTKCKKLCVSGGVALNSVANGKLREQTPFEDIYITPACSDTGITLGLALYGYFNHARPPRPAQVYMPTAYTGRTYAVADIRGLLDRFNVPYKPRAFNAIAQEIVDQRIVGWFVGGSEIGPRALGHRSIVVDPRNPHNKDILNHRVKHRESFRPFAPAILEEHVSEYFPITHRTPFMLEVFPFREEAKDIVPSVVHVDGTGRLQTVSFKDSPEFYQLIKAFYELSGVPILLNTSFNDKEPIVETPEDALITFLSTEIDVLVLEELVLCKRDIRPDVIEQAKSVLINERDQRISEGLASTKKRYFRNYSDSGAERFLHEEEVISQWHLKYKAKHELERFLREQHNRQDRILIYGTRKHTRVLFEKLFDFPKLNVVGFIAYSVHPHEEETFGVYPEVGTEFLEHGTYDRIIVSSHEYQEQILKHLDQCGVPASKRYVVYDNAGDSLVRHLAYLPTYNFAV